MPKKHLTKFNIHFIIKQKRLRKIGVEGNILNLIMNTYKNQLTGISLVVQWLRRSSRYRGPRFGPCQGSRFQVPKLKILHGHLFNA